MVKPKGRMTRLKVRRSMQRGWGVLLEYLHSAPSSYMPSRQGNKYQSQGTVNLNVPDDTNYKKFTETDQLLHILGLAMIQAHGLHKVIKLFGQETRNAVQKEMQQHRDMETYIPVDPSKLTIDEKREAVKLLCNIVKK